MGMRARNKYHCSTSVVEEPVVLRPVRDSIAIFSFELPSDLSHEQLSVVALAGYGSLRDFLQSDWVEDVSCGKLLVQNVDYRQ